MDTKGRFYVGTMNDPAVLGDVDFTDEGIMFRLDPDLSIHRIQENIKIPNGISWTLDNRTMYMTDSPSGEITQYPYDPDTGKISLDQGKTFFKCPIEGGVPDGHCQDEEGHFWVALFGTGKQSSRQKAWPLCSVSPSSHSLRRRAWEQTLMRQPAFPEILANPSTHYF